MFWLVFFEEQWPKLTHNIHFPRVLDIPGALIAAACGLLLDGIMFTLISLYKCPVMLFKGWKRLIQDMIGREGPFLETACVPFAGLAILLWPFAVVGAVLASILSSIPLGAYGAVVAYQVPSKVFFFSSYDDTHCILFFGCYLLDLNKHSLSPYDEYELI